MKCEGKREVGKGKREEKRGMIAAKNAKVDWKTVTLGEIIVVKYGKDHKRLNDGPYPVYGSGGYMRSVEKPLTELPSLLIPRKGTLNNVMYSESPFWTVDTMFWAPLRDEKICDLKFVYYRLKLIDFQKLNVGSAVPSLTVPVIEEQEISLPPLPTQRKIAAVLGALDDKIENNRKICANLEAQAQALFKSWFVDFEPLGGKMPKDWKMGKLGDVFLFKRGSSISKRDVVLKRDSENRFVVYGAGREVFGFLKHADINEPTVLITAIGAGAGDVTRSYERQYSVTSNAFYVSTKDGYHFPYAYYKLLNVDFHLFCTGSAQPMLAYNSFANEDVVVPCNKTIDSFCKYCWPLIKKIDSLKSLYYSLSELRDTLLPKLMSGELDVDDVEV